MISIVRSAAAYQRRYLVGDARQLQTGTETGHESSDTLPRPAATARRTLAGSGNEISGASRKRYVQRVGQHDEKSVDQTASDTLSGSDTKLLAKPTPATSRRAGDANGSDTTSGTSSDATTTSRTAAAVGYRDGSLDIGDGAERADERIDDQSTTLTASDTSSD